MAGTIERSTYFLPYIPLVPAKKSIISALGNAVIEKADLKWLNIEKLSADFPSRVQVLDQTVNFVGPVRIIFPSTPAQIASGRYRAAVIFGLFCLPFGCWATLLFLKRNCGYTSRSKRNFVQLHPRACAGAVSLIFSLASAVIFFQLLAKVKAGQPGIDFFQMPIIRLT
jgi:hypothetical protein